MIYVSTLLTLAVSVKCNVQRFSVQPQTVNVTRGSEVTLPCKIENRVGQVQWVKSGLTLGYDNAVTGYPRYSIAGSQAEGEFNFKIVNVSMEDEGEYECQVLGPPNLRASASLWVDIAPTKIEMSSLQQVKANEEIEITCKVFDARPRAEIVLKRAGADYSVTSSEESDEEGSSSELVTTTTKFKLTPRSSDNNIPFSCSAVHSTLSDGQLQDEHVLEVLYPPNAPVVSIVGHSLGDSLRAGQDIQLQCESYGGNPLANLEWYKGGDKIDTSYTGHDHHKSVNTYSFTATEDDNNVVFKCEASNQYLASPLSDTLELKVLFPPKEVKITGADSASINETLTFTCESAKSNPKSSLQWVVDSKSVTPEVDPEVTPVDGGGFTTKSEITIRVSDYDRYKVVSCVANNVALGERVHKSHKVTIEYPPDELLITGWTENVVFLEGSVQKIKCTAMTGNPLPKLKWKNADGNVAVQDLNTEKDDDGTEISVSNEMTLTMSKNDNQKAYSCVAKEKKKDGKILLKKDIPIKVHFLPETVQITQPDKLVENMLANFTCTSSPSNPRVDIVWRYNNKVMQAGGSLTTSETSVGGFITSSFLPIRLTDAHIDGKIKCEARHNITDKSVFDSIDLDVKYTPKFLSVPGPTTAEEGETITLSVSAKANPNVVDYFWKRDDELIPGPSGTHHSRWSHDKNVLTLENLQLSDAGDWVVVANNSIGQTTASIKVSIQYPASIVSITDLENSPIELGNAIEIRCKVIGNPLDDSVVKWEKLGSDNDFKNETSFSNGESILYIGAATAEMSGNYTCVANNKVPKASPKTVKKGTYVRVKHKPILDMSATVSKVACDKEKIVVPTCKLTCQASGTPDVSITWLRKGNNIKDDDKYGIVSTSLNVISVKSELELKSVRSDDYDNYTCIASNVLGDVRHDVALTVDGKPDPPVHFVATAATHDSVSLKWRLDFTGGYKLEDVGFRIRQKKDGAEHFIYRDVPKGSSEFKVEDLQSATKYSFNILAFNEKGDSDYTTDIVQKETEAAPPAPEAPAPPGESPPSPGPAPKTYSEILSIIASIGGALLICNLALLYCYVQRKNGRNIFGSSESTMSRSSILEMYFSNSGDGESVGSRSDSQSIGSVDADDDMEDDSDIVASRERVDMWRHHDDNRRHATRYSDYTPSPPPWPQDPRRRPWQYH